MEKAAYYEIATYLKHADRAVSPHELSVILGKSRVTIQSSLKRLLKNGWVAKEGSSPYTFYRGVEINPMPKSEQKGEVTIEDIRGICKIGLIEDFVLKSNKIRQKPL
ncbi:MAG TPA: hypothetical protein VGE18_03195 [Candidatus Paceibacterota bacterium]